MLPYLSKGKSRQWWRLNLSFIVFINWSSLNLRDKVSMISIVKRWFSENNNMQQSQYFIKGTIPEGYNLYNPNCTFSSPIYTFLWRETQFFTRQIKVQIGKSTLIILFIKEKECRHWRKINTFPSISPLTDSVLSIFRQKKYGPIRRKWISKWLFPRRHNK